MNKVKDIQDFFAGIHVKQTGYRSFQPEKINCQWIISNPQVNQLLAEANRFLGELNTYSQLVPDVNAFIAMHVVKEATNSSKIEGTKTNIGEALLKEEDIHPEKRNDWEEVQNYIKAMNFGLERLKELPLSNRLLRETHKILMQGVRGEHKMPGEFRTSQNWIGGATLSDAVFIPPIAADVPALMGDLEKFIHNTDISVPELIRIALVHYQFETIHPFLDGNGRIGRLLITLYLVSIGILTKPTLYISAFFEKNRALYYYNLMNTRQTNDLVQWLKFFLVGVIETSKNAAATLKAIIDLREKTDRLVVNTLGKRAPKVQQVLQLLYKSPVITAAEVEEKLNVSTPTANAIIKNLVDLDILKELTGMKRHRVFTFEAYILLFEKEVG